MGGKIPNRPSGVSRLYTGVTALSLRSSQLDQTAMLCSPVGWWVPLWRNSRCHLGKSLSCYVEPQVLLSREGTPTDGLRGLVLLVSVSPWTRRFNYPWHCPTKWLHFPSLPPRILDRIKWASDIENAVETGLITIRMLTLWTWVWICVLRLKIS